MLERLSIENFAIIGELELELSAHLNILTGETGAGKSIILGALSLILGERAEPEALMDRGKKCIIEGQFTQPRQNLVRKFFEEQDLDPQDRILLRREITPQGKSRAFINDTPVTLQRLNQLADLLVDLHQQFDTRQLGKAEFQLEILDALSRLQESCREYRELFQNYRRRSKALADLKARNLAESREQDYIGFLYRELEEARFEDGELEQLEEELKSLTHAELILKNLEEILDALEGSEGSAQSLLRRSRHLLEAVQAYSRDIAELSGRLDIHLIDLQDIARDLSRIRDRVVLDPGRIAEISERISLGYRLLQKHKLKSSSELLVLKEQIAARLNQAQDLDLQANREEQALAELEGRLQERSLLISQARRAQAGPFSEQVNHLLARVGMPNASLRVDIQDSQHLEENGRDLVEFLFDANRNGQFASLRKVASGGELSRLMLCIQSLVASTLELPTLIFDEIDSGISGEAARQVGILLKELSQRHQVICITHQPQIAAMGESHFLVYKEQRQGRTQACTRRLDHEDRVLQIAQMLGGTSPSGAVLKHARELVGSP